MCGTLREKEVWLYRWLSYEWANKVMNTEGEKKGLWEVDPKKRVLCMIQVS